jgi:hypothetical protein
MNGAAQSLGKFPVPLQNLNVELKRLFHAFALVSGAAASAGPSLSAPAG